MAVTAVGMPVAESKDSGEKFDSQDLDDLHIVIVREVRADSFQWGHNVPRRTHQ